MTDPAPPWRTIDAADMTPATPPGARAASADQRPDPVVLRSAALVGLAAILAVGAFVLALGGGDGSGVVVETSAVPVSPGTAGEQPRASALVVEVAGAVVDPGMFRVPDGTRVGDLIALAGGYGPRVDAVRVDAELNLAAPVSDGQRVRVPSRDDVAAVAPAATEGPDAASDGLVDLNTATLEQLDTLPGVGPVTAEKIVAAREEAPFTAVEELRSRGILGEKTFEQVQALVAVP